VGKSMVLGVENQWFSGPPNSFFYVADHSKFDVRLVFLATNFLMLGDKQKSIDGVHESSQL
jgi:hypothetical protein